jgi:hypothetical protein
MSFDPRIAISLGDLTSEVVRKVLAEFDGIGREGLL